LQTCLRMHWRVCLRMRPHCSHFRMRPQTANAAICGCGRVPERNCKCICVHTSAQCNQQYMVASVLFYCRYAQLPSCHASVSVSSCLPRAVQGTSHWGVPRVEQPAPVSASHCSAAPCPLATDTIQSAYSHQTALSSSKLLFI